jgi:Endonuclease IV
MLLKESVLLFRFLLEIQEAGMQKNSLKKTLLILNQNFKESKIDRFATCAHMPYLPNLASPKDDGFEKSVKTLINEVERCAQLGIPYLVTHLGSHLGTGEESGIKRLVKGLTKAGQTKNDVIILLENTAGQKKFCWF